MNPTKPDTQPENLSAEKAEATTTRSAKVYIAGPMTGIDELNFPLFNAEAARLRALGWEVTNPAEVQPDQTAQWIDCMLDDIPALMSCDVVALLPGWETSKGARIEHCVALNHGMEVVMAADLVTGPWWLCSCGSPSLPGVLHRADRPCAAVRDEGAEC